MNFFTITYGIADIKTYICYFSEVIKKRISHYKITEINFNLMAVVADQKLLIENKIDSLNKQVEQLDRDDGTGMSFHILYY